MVVCRRNNTHKHVTEECRLKNISGAAIKEPVFNLVEKLITNEYFLNLVSDPEEVAELRKLIEMLSSGTYRNKQEVGDMFGMSQAQVSRLCRSAFLSPVIVEKLVDGTLPLPRFTADHASPLGRATRAPGDRVMYFF